SGRDEAFLIEYCRDLAIHLVFSVQLDDPLPQPINVDVPVGRSKSPGYGHLKLPHLMIAVSAAEQQ
ncbi:hypothetical protein, partial [Bradyrhizobium sp. Mp27]|uniref:hypothetical protein n=1 Tax=Bradyrhizobium sp. Mp27 TaxID=3042157 RepID=UPI00248C1091